MSEALLKKLRRDGDCAINLVGVLVETADRALLESERLENRVSELEAQVRELQTEIQKLKGEK